MNTLVPHRPIAREIKLPRWLRRTEASCLAVSFVPAYYLLLLGAVPGRPVFEFLSRSGATQLLPVVSYFGHLFAPLDGAANDLRPFLASGLASIPKSAITHLYLGSMAFGVASLILSMAVSITLANLNDVSKHDTICW